MHDEHAKLEPSPEDEAPISSFRSPRNLLLAALALGLLFEILFDGHPIGISYVIWAAGCVAALLVMAYREDIKPSRPEIFLPIGILLLAALNFVRKEPLTSFLNTVVTLFLFAVWIHSFRKDRLIDYGWLDFTVAFIQVPVEGWVRPWPVASAGWRALVGERQARSSALAILRGILLALPIVIIFLGLLVSADLIFADYVEHALRWLDIEAIFRFARRAFVVFFSAMFFLGALVAALRDPGKHRLIGLEKPVIAPFLGFTEAAVILTSVNLIFIAFVGVQFAYLFGGEANITAAGYTYSEYARRGFGELTLLAFLSLGMIMTLGTWTKRDVRQKPWFDGLSAGLVGLMGVILVSALKRLLLYESAYGFTRLRTYTHVAIVWMGVMFVVFVVLLFMNRLRRFAPAAALGVIGFTLTLNLLNVDGFIVRQNVRRQSTTGEIDLQYLASLSSDAIPDLMSYARQAPSEVSDDLLPLLACRQAIFKERLDGLRWPSTHLSDLLANRAFDINRPLLEPYTVEHDRNGWSVEVDGEQVSCYPSRFWD